MALKNKALLSTDKDTAYPDNTGGAITPAIMRPQVQDEIDSFLNLAASNPEQSVLSSVDFLGGLKANGVVLETSEKVVFVNESTPFANLPAPVGTLITGDANTVYLISGDVDISPNEWAFGENTVLLGSSRFVDKFISDTSNTFLTATDTHQIRELQLVCPNAQFLDLSGTTAQTCLYTNIFVSAVKTMGTINDWGTTVFRSLSPINVTDLTEGKLLFTGSHLAFNMDNSLWQGFVAGSMIDLGTATFDRVQIQSGNRFSTVSGVTAIIGAASSANINTGGGGVISGVIFEGAGTAITGIDKGSIGWSLTGNRGIEETRKDAFNAMINNATDTVISAQDTPTKVLGTFIDQNSSQFTTDSAGRSTYIGIDPIHVPIHASVDVEPVTGVNIKMSLYIAMNGSVIAETQGSTRTAAGSPESISTFWQGPIVNGDYFETWVENNTNGNDLLVTNDKYIIN